MTVIRSKPGALKTLALKSEVVISTSRGQLIASSWPRKRGKPTNPITIEQNEWLKWSARALPYAATVEWDTAMKATKGTGLYPRDVLTMAATGKLYDIVTPEGQVLTRTDDRLEIKVFNGAILRLTANQAIAAATVQALIWPLPVRDTFGFWDPGNPTRLTIPAGVDFVEMVAGISRTPANTQRILVAIRDNAGNIYAEQDTGHASAQASTVSTGAIDTTAGQWFEAVVFATIGTTIIGNPTAFFNLNVLGSS